MACTTRLRPHWLPAALALILLAPGSAASGQEQEADADDAVVVPQMAMFELNEMQFDIWVFGNTNGGDSIQKRLATQLSLLIDRVDRCCKLSDAQKEKLKLAGRGDSKRFFDRVDEKRRKYLNMKVEQNKINEIYQELQPLSVVFNAGLFGGDSLYGKTLKTTLDPEQATRFEQVSREQSLFRYKAAVDLMVSRLSAVMGLTSDQSRKLSHLITEETRPPKNLGRAEFYAVTYHASKIPPAKFKSILDEPQMRVLERQFQRVRGLEQYLKTQGYVPDDEPAKGTEKPQSRKAEANHGFLEFFIGD